MIHEAFEDYLEAVLVLQERLDGVHAAEVARFLNVSRPSAGEYLKKLISKGLLTLDEHSHLHLTEEGNRIAASTYERHIVITELFVKLGVAPDVAAEDACRVEHAISGETFEAIKKFCAEHHQG